jgi:hypothetical protein
VLTIPGQKGNPNQNHTKIPSYPCLNCYHKEHQQQQMLAKMWGEKNPHTLLVAIIASTMTMENIMEAP